MSKNNIPDFGLNDIINQSSSITIQKMGIGSFFSQIIPELKDASKNVFKENKLFILKSIAAGATIGLMATSAITAKNYFETNSSKEIVKTEQASNTSILNKISENVTAFTQKLQQEEVDNREYIKNENLKIGVSKHESGYETQKLLSPLKGITEITDDRNNVFEKSGFVNNKNKEHLNEIGKFEITEKLAPNQIANVVARHMFRKGNYYEALLVTGEGFQNVAADNIGATIYHGVNTKFQTRSTMFNLITALSENPETIKAYTEIANKEDTSSIQKSLKGNLLNNAKALQMSVMLQDNIYDRGAKQGLSRNGKDGHVVLNNLEKNIQAVVKYMPYKVGNDGFYKYSNFISELQKYSELPIEQRTKEMRESLADKINFKYTLIVEKDGKKEKVIKEDKRATMLLRSLLISEQGFGYMINEDVKPSYFNSLNKKVTGSDDKLDENEFKGLEVLPSLNDDIKKLQNEGYKVNFDKFYTPEQNIQNEVDRWNSDPRNTTATENKKRFCIGTSTISC